MANTYLTVPFSEKDSAKSKGARWDSVARKWYAPEGADLVAFAEWLPADAAADAGLATDENASVLDAGGRPIEGLYACGNTTASVMGYSYPAAGATLGPAMTFGFLAGRHLTGANE